MEVTNLKAYLANIGLTLKDFCEIIDIDDKHMSKIIHGHKNAGHRLAKDVREMTDGIILLKTRVRKRDLKRHQQQQKQNQNHQCCI